ncbi:hypothetical protein Tco_0611699 [Tanacetum coccineum]
MEVLEFHLRVSIYEVLEGFWRGDVVRLEKEQQGGDVASLVAKERNRGACKKLGDIVVINLKDVENDFMLDNSYGDETLEELTAAVILMAQIQSPEDNDVTEPSKDAWAVNEVNASHKMIYNRVQEHKNHGKCKTVINTSDDDQINSNIIFDDPYVENNGGSAEHDSNAHDQYHDVKILAYNYSVLTGQLIRRIHQLDTTYQTYYSGQRIEFYSLNNVFVLPKQYGVFSELNTAYWPSTDLYGVFTLIGYGDNAFNGMDGGGVIDHIAKVLEIIDWIKMPNVEKNELRLHVFSKSLSGDAKTWWNHEINASLTLVKKIFKKFYPLSCASNYDKMCDDDEEGRDPLKFITWRNSKFKDQKKVDETTKRALLYTWIEIGNEEGLLNDEVLSDEEWEEHEYGNPPNDSFPKPYLNINNEKDKNHHN